MALDDETSKKIIRQVEFYFSDSNLPRDKFLKQSISESEDGMVSLALLCSFSRMRTHLGLGDAKPEDISEETVKGVAETLRTSTFLKLSEDGKKVGRVSELPKVEEVTEQIDVRTVAASPFEYDIKLEGVESFFGQFGKVNSVRLPRHVADKRLFSGTALIEFSSEEEVTKLLQKSVTYAGLVLEFRMKKVFDSERAKLEEEVEISRQQSGSRHKETSPPEENYPKGLILGFNLKKISVDVATEQNGKQMEVDDAVVSKSGETQQTDEKMLEDVGIDQETDKEEKKDGNDELKVGLEIETKESHATEETLETPTETKESHATEESLETPTETKESHATEETLETPTETEGKSSKEGVSSAAVYKDNKDVVLREDLKSIFQKFGTVKFIDFRIGSDSGYIRFEDAEASQKARAAAVLSEEGGLTVKNFIAILDPVIGEAEKEYWSLLRSNQDSRRQNFKGNRGRGGGRHNNRGGWKNSRPRGNDSPSSHPNKAQKVEVA